MKITKVTVNATTRKLSAKYTLQETQDIVYQMDDEASSELARILQEEIDREIVESIQIERLKAEGWTEAKNNFNIGPRTKKRWLEDNAQGEYKIFVKSVLFSRASDATMFVLKWSDT